MPNRVQWNPQHSIGNEILDNQHRNILAQCNVLADCIDAAQPESDQRFHQILAELMILAREHFAAEELFLTNSAYPEIDEHRMSFWRRKSLPKRTSTCLKFRHF
jgi:hemerythrin-like metal-binding protein